ncbi:MAG: hypothetical protein IT558_06305 [Alphaproteobacteria bacterium]|nr:hypothetical protein [Alphaproteobacteria bacterium]
MPTDTFSRVVQTPEQAARDRESLELFETAIFYGDLLSQEGQKAMLLRSIQLIKPGWRPEPFNASEVMLKPEQ